MALLTTIFGLEKANSYNLDKGFIATDVSSRDGKTYWRVWVGKRNTIVTKGWKSSLVFKQLISLKITNKSYWITLKIAFSAKLVDLQVRVGILPEIGLITSIVW